MFLYQIRRKGVTNVQVGQAHRDLGLCALRLHQPQDVPIAILCPLQGEQLDVGRVDLHPRRRQGQRAQDGQQADG